MATNIKAINVSRAPGLMDRMFAIHAEVEGSTPTGGTCLNDFSDPTDQDIRTQCALSWKIVVSGWRSVIAVSLNVDGGVRLIKSAKLYMCVQTHYKHDEDGSTAPGVRGHGSVPLNHSGNVVTKIGIHSHMHYRCTITCRTPAKKTV